MSTEREIIADDIPRAASAEVAEFQGLYGAYHVSELLLQKIWLRGAIDGQRAKTTRGETLRVLHPGAWNRLSGPDFCRAKLEIGGRAITGDVEVHFRHEAWTQHGHDRDPAYDDVVLHVVLFPPVPGAVPVRTSSGRELPTLVLVDLLWHDLEEYAADEAVSALSGRDPMPVVEALLAMDAKARELALTEAAAARWNEKVHFAKLRIERCGWEEACHQTALEILGYRSNRAAMLRVAGRYSWAEWHRTADALTLEALVAAAAETWTVRGVRPANHPRRRLQQYADWMMVVADWPLRLRELKLPVLAGRGEVSSAAAAVLRKRLGFAALREAIAQDTCGGELGGTRFDTWVCNLALPFLAAIDVAPDDAVGWWTIWLPGDVPEALKRAARHVSSPGKRSPMTNGRIQGLIGMLLQRKV